MGNENQKGAPADPGAFLKVLGALSQGQKIRALEIARKHGIPDDDPVWHVVLTVAEAEEGMKEIAQSLRAASVKVTEATRDEVKAARDKAKIEIETMQEDVKVKVAAALEKTLETEIREAVNQLKGQSNRPLHKKWLIAMGVGLLISSGLGGWGTYSIHKKWVAEGWDKGVEEGISIANPTVKYFHDLIDCAFPGGKVQWSSDGKKAYCIASPDPKTGQPAKWRIR